MSGALPRVVVVGAGFGGLRAARDLCRAPVLLTVVDRANHHLFRPLVYQVATAALAPESIAVPVREVVGRWSTDTAVVMAEVVGADLERRQLFTSEGRAIPYDYAVLAPGAIPNFFGNDAWAAHMFHLGSLGHAMLLREHILETFEKAENEDDPVERRALLTFVVIGAGPSGVELAGALAELGRAAMPRDFERVRPDDVRVVLLEMKERVLLPFHEDLSAKAQRMLERLGVEVRCNATVTNVDDSGVEVGDETRFASRTVCWTTGVRPVPLGDTLGLPVDERGAIVVEPDLSIRGRPELFALGDSTSFVPEGQGEPLPWLAPVAIQQGQHVAACIRADLKGRERSPFSYRDKGMLAAVGRSRAVMQRGSLRMAGTLAWLVWCVVHILYLVGFRNQLKVLLDWFWQYLRFRPGARVLTQEVGPHPGEPEARPRLVAPSREASSPR